MSEGIVLRTHRDEKYKTIHVGTIEDCEHLSWKAKGIYTYLISRPDGWEFYKKDLLNRSPDGRTSLDNGLKELKQSGLLTVKKDRNDKGQFKGWTWIIREVPKDGKPENRINLSSDSPTVGKSGDITSNSNSKEKNNKEKKQQQSTYRETAENLLTHWNDEEAGTQHRSLREPMVKAVRARMKDEFTEEEIRTAISNLAKAWHSENHYWSHKWTLKEFLSREEGGKMEKFLDGIDWCLVDDSKSKGGGDGYSEKWKRRLENSPV